MIVGGDITITMRNDMKILGLNDETDAGKVVRISRDGVTFEKNGARVVLTLADVETMVFSN
jgi:hypothetical protein